MSKIRLTNGTIIAIPLKEFNSGIVYAKFLDPPKVWEKPRNLPGILRVFNFFTDTIERDATKIGRDLLLPPIAIAGQNGAHKLGWERIAVEPIIEEDRFLPHTKSGWPHVAPVPEKWLYMEELGNTMKQYFADFEQVRHLESGRLLGIDILRFRIVMEKYKIEGKDIKDYFDLNWLEEIEYKTSNSQPIYSQLPENLKGRAILPDNK